jgi:cytochrome c-type biogenesis protein CcmH/NrfG
MTKQNQNAFSALNAVTGIAGVLLGVIVGYIIGVGQAAPGAATSAAASVTPAAPSTPAVSTVVNEAELQAYRDILASDPKNVKAAVELANKLYDAGRYAEAIPYYQQAVALDPKNANANTDLGTALYYAGRPDDALVQLGKSLEVDPKHGQTLYNIGIIKRDAKKDPKGAVEAWERLLRVNPDYPDAARVRTLIAETK